MTGERELLDEVHRNGMPWPEWNLKGFQEFVRPMSRLFVELGKNVRLTVVVDICSDLRSSVLGG